jgi:hypothetical protein
MFAEGAYGPKKFPHGLKNPTDETLLSVGFFN